MFFPRHGFKTEMSLKLTVGGLTLDLVLIFYRAEGTGVIGTNKSNEIERFVQFLYLIRINCLVKWRILTFFNKI